MAIVETFCAHVMTGRVNLAAEKFALSEDERRKCFETCKAVVSKGGYPQQADCETLIKTIVVDRGDQVFDVERVGKTT